MKPQIETHEGHVALVTGAGQGIGQAIAFAPALTLLAVELYNILAFHLTLAPANIPPALVAAVLWVVVFLQYRASFQAVFAAKPTLEME